MPSYFSLLAAVSLAMLSVASATPHRIYAAPDGAAGNAGTSESPVSWSVAVARAEEYLQKDKDYAGLEIILEGGRYAITQREELGTAFRGTKEHPIVIQPAEGAEVVFDGQAAIPNVAAFAPVAEATELARLAPSARGRVVATEVTNPALAKALARRVNLSLLLNERPYAPSVYPNSGYAYLDRTPAVPETCPPGIPKEDQDYRVRAGRPPHQEPGRKRGWLGSLDEPRGAHAKLITGSPSLAGSWPQWQAELERNRGRVEMTGFFEAVWKESRVPIHSVDAATETIRPAKAFSYGFGWLDKQPFRIYGLLCEVDRPGEWHYDVSSRKLYIYPPEGGLKSVGLPVANGFLLMRAAEHVHVKGVTVENIGSGSAFALSGQHNLIAGCTIRSCLASGVMVGGRGNRVQSCDFIDLQGHLRLSGGRRGPNAITEGGNTVENCHFYHHRYTHLKVRIYVDGVGQTFRNNLIHNSIGQAVMVRGNDHLIERNELFNIGYEEGDGAAVYSGGDMTGYGTVYRHNFFHHLMRTPNKRLGRAGIMLDDHQAGATIVGNVFYKSCDAAIQINCGPGNVTRGNVFLEGKHGILNLGSWGPRAYAITEAIKANPRDRYAGEKEDYIGRAERIVGKRGWNNEPWKSRYPLFAKVMNDDGEVGRMWPIRSVYDNNIYHGNLHDEPTIKNLDAALRAKSTIKGPIVVGTEIFADYDAMDFTMDAPPEGVANIPFAKIGLYADEFRTDPPDKASYRRAIRDFYADEKSYKPYREQFNSAALMQ